MFSIIISEKGGAERRESFDKTEINVGRVQGNDLMLPKGNVSKRHARLLYRDGRFIVTDLKSTNGTYVNGRKIAQATIVREGDKIYIGDFVLRIELAGEGVAQPGAPEGVVADAAHPPVHHEQPAQQDGSDARPLPAAAAPQGASVAPAPFSRPSAPMPPPLPGPQTAGPPPMAVSSPPIPPAPAAPRAEVDAPMGGAPSVASSNGPQIGAQPLMMVGGGARETSLGPGPRAPAPPQIVAATPVGPHPPGSPPGPPPQAPVPPSNLHPSAMGLAPGQQGRFVEGAHPAPIAPGFVPQPPPIGVVDGVSAFGAPSHPAMVPSSAPPGVAPSQLPPEVGRQQLPSVPSQLPSPPAKVSAPPPPASGPASSGSAGISSSGLSAAPRSSVRSAAASEGVVDSSQAAAHRSALLRLMDRTTQAVDVSALANGEAPAPALAATIERTLAEKAGQMRDSGELPSGVDADVLLGEARRELFELGPLGPLLEDEYVEEVQLIRHDHVVAMHGKKQVATEIAFTSEAAVARLVRRICVRAGRPLHDQELFVDRRLEQGARLFGVLPPASGDGHMLVVRKPQRALSTLDDLVKSGTIARQMATLLAQAVQGRANILVTGSVGAGATTLLGALAGAGSLEDRVVVLQEDDELVLSQPHTVSMLIGDTAEEGARAVHAAIRVRPDRLVIGAFAGHVVAEIVDAVGDGVDGVLVAARAPTLRHLVARLPAEIAATKKLATPDTAREWLAGSFDLVLEVARLRDGRNRVMRVAEFALTESNPLELRDIFTFTVERTAAGGTVEGSFHPTGVVPRIAEDLVSRGVPLDLAMFKRSSR